MAALRDDYPLPISTKGAKKEKRAAVQQEFQEMTDEQREKNKVLLEKVKKAAEDAAGR
jgi:hypothetical protein